MTSHLPEMEKSTQDPQLTILSRDDWYSLYSDYHQLVLWPWGNPLPLSSEQMCTFQAAPQAVPSFHGAIRYQQSQAGNSLWKPSNLKALLYTPSISPSSVPSDYV